MTDHQRDTSTRLPDYYTNTKTVSGYMVHRSHHFIAADDVLECSTCTVRPYNDGAKLPCPEDEGHGGPE